MQNLSPQKKRGDVMGNNGRSGITYPLGFLASGLHAGIKKGQKRDLSLIFSESPCVVSAVFTTNKFKSNSILYSMKQVRNNINAVLINSGNANTCNGRKSYEDTIALCGELAEILSISKDSVLVASTGSIGQPLPYEKISGTLPELASGLAADKGGQAAEGIMTTDTVIKEFCADTNVSGDVKVVSLGGMAKGSGMIDPCMATMLAFITTDAAIEKVLLDSALKEAVEESFNMITVDNDRSTNDMVLCMANGMAGNSRIAEGGQDYLEFKRCLGEACRDLAKKIAADGEGATRLIEVEVAGAWSIKDARRIAKKVAGSNLFKSSIYGKLPGWGRIIAAVGSVHARVDVRNTEISICGLKVYCGQPVAYSMEEMGRRLEGEEIKVSINVKKGGVKATAWGCDLTEEYVHINKE